VHGGPLAPGVTQEQGGGGGGGGGPGGGTGGAAGVIELDAEEAADETP
jgi:hypothetical protein